MKRRILRVLAPRGARSKLIGTTAVAATALVPFVPNASAAKTHTAVTIDGVFYENGTTLFTGSVISVRKACASKRAVTIFRQRPGADQTIGTTKSYKKSGVPLFYWSHTAKGSLPFGTYYAKVKPTTQCGGNTSLDYSGPG